MAQSYKAKNPIQSVKTSFKIIRQLQIREGASGAELAESLDMSKGSIHNHLQTLYEVGYVTRENDVYHLGLRFLEHGIYARQRYSIYEVAKPEVDRLAEKTGELANLLVEEHGLGTYLYRAKGDNSVNVDARIGTHVHLHNTALGKSILAHRPQSEVESILDRHGMPAKTERLRTGENCSTNWRRFENKALPSTMKNGSQGCNVWQFQYSIRMTSQSVR